MNREEKAYLVKFLHGTKYRYVLPLFLAGSTILILLRMYIDISIIYIFLFMLLCLPFMIIHLKSVSKTHQLSISKDKVRIGATIVDTEALQKIVIYTPITIYFYMKSKGKQKQTVEAIQTTKEDAKIIILVISEWAKANDIELVKN